VKLEINGTVRDLDRAPGTYQRVREAIHLAARLKRGGK
jgi:hypothetical protein